MTDPQQSEKQPETASDDDRPGHDGASTEDRTPTEDRDPTGTDTAATAAPTPPADDAGPARSGGRKGVLLGVGGVVLVAAAAAFVVTAFVTPGFLAGPGSPDDAVARATAALAGKSAPDLEQASCQGPDGKPIASVPPEALQQIQSATQTGPPQLTLDTQAQAPLDLALAGPDGQPQTLPAEMQFGVTDGEWCLTGIAQRQ